MFRHLFLLLIFFSISISTRADYLEVRRSAILERTPDREAESVSHLETGVLLLLLKEKQTNGYYNARDPESEPKGWIYRMLFRRYSGDIPRNREEEETSLEDTEDIEETSEDSEEPIPVYNRNQWKHGIDADKDCQNTRDEVLIDETLSSVEFRAKTQCKVSKGKWRNRYSGVVYTDPVVLDVDHMVPLENAHLSGARAWDAKQRQKYDNDLEYSERFVAVYRSLNRAKDAKG